MAEKGALINVDDEGMPAYAMAKTSGDLTIVVLVLIIQYDAKDEIGALANDFARMNQNVKGLINETASSIQSVAKSSELITENVEGLTTASTEEQLSRVTEIGHAIEVLSEDIVKLSTEMGIFKV